MRNAFQRVQLGELLTRSVEMVEIASDKLYQQVTIRLWGKGVVLRDVVSGAEIAADRRYVVRAQQFILSKIDARNGAFGLVPDSLDGAIVSSDFPVFKLNRSLILPKFLDWISKTNDFIDFCKAASEGTTNRIRLREDQFLATQISLPPLSEQQRIVARIEELAGKIEEARGLQREAGEEAEALLVVTLKEMREKLLNSSSPKDRIGNIMQVSSGGTPSRGILAYWGGDIPWIKTGELLDGDVYQSEEHITRWGLENSSAKLFPLDTILVALYGQGQTRGRTGRLRIEATTNQACCAILPNPTLLKPRFTQYWLRSLYIDLREVVRDGAQPNWNGQMIKNIEIVLPTLSDQQSIIVYLDDIQSKVGSLKQLQSETSAELDALLPTILDKAFKGEL